MKVKNILNPLGIILMAFGFLILIPIATALLYNDYYSIIPFVFAATLSLILGLVARWYGRFSKNIDSLSKREGLLIVSSAWLFCSLVGAVPYLFYGLHPVDAFFESASGITTTGATILTDFSMYPKAFFFWRSLTQWLGGMGIIVLFIAILPQFAVAGRQMFFAEAPGPTEEKITPRIKHTAKALWLVYLLLTLLEAAALSIAGMPIFDAVCNSLTTLAAGGFSPHPLSIMGYQNSAATWIIIVFMFLAGSNFALQYRLIIKGKPGPLFNNEEFRVYSVIIFFLAVFLVLFLIQDNTYDVSSSIRDSAFQIISILTTTGFSSTDFALWSVPAQTFLFIAMLVGGCAGSAGGGVKVVRISFLFKYLRRETVQAIHPKAVLPLKIGKAIVSTEIQGQILGFLFFYLTIILLSSIAVTLIEGNSSVGLVGTLATIGNIGPGFGEIGPMGTFGGLSPLTKLIFICNMIVGRLELIPFLVMLHPDFWKK